MSRKIISSVQVTDQLNMSLTEFNRLLAILTGMAPGVEFNTKLFTVTKTSDGLIKIVSRLTEFDTDRLLRAESLSNCGLKIVC